MWRYIFLVLSLAIFLPLQATETEFELYFIRHADKMSEPRKDPNLTPKGHKRAKALSEFLENHQVEKIYSTNYRRTKQTAEPVANSKKLKVEEYNPNELAALAQKLLKEKRHSLIVGHSNTTPQLVSLVGGEAMQLTEADFGDLTILSLDMKTGNIETKYVKIKP